MKTNLTLLTLGVCFFFAFIIFSYLVDVNLFKSFDFDTTVRLQDNINRRFDFIFSWFSFLGAFEVTSFALILLLLVGRKIIPGLVGLFLFGVFHVIEIAGKGIVENVPPPEFLLRTKRLVEFPQFHVRSEYSYPSGHSGRTVFLSVFILVFLWKSRTIPRLVKVLILCTVIIFNLSMLVSRIYLGEHWATDVIGGAVLGGAFGLISTAFYPHRKMSSVTNQKIVE